MKNMLGVKQSDRILNLEKIKPNDHSVNFPIGDTETPFSRWASLFGRGAKMGGPYIEVRQGGFNLWIDVVNEDDAEQIEEIQNRYVEAVIDDENK